MEKIISLKKNYQFRLVYNRGKSIANKYLVLFVLKNKVSKNRLGISISKKVDISVGRNRIRRLIKENYRFMQKELKPGYDLVIIVRQPCINADYKIINKALSDLFRKHKLYL